MKLKQTTIKSVPGQHMFWLNHIARLHQTLVILVQLTQPCGKYDGEGSYPQSGEEADFSSDGMQNAVICYIT